MSTGPGSNKRVRGDRNPAHQQRLNYLLDVGKKRSEEVDKASEQIHAIFSRAAADYLTEVDKLETRDEGRITAVIDALTAAEKVAVASVQMSLYPQTAVQHN
jgi:hypothetical protein